VPRTGRSHIPCREFDCELRVQGALHHMFDGVLSIPKFAWGAANAGGLRNRDAGAPLSKFVIHRSTSRHELRKQRGTSKFLILVPLFDLKFLDEFAAGGVGTSNRRHWCDDRSCRHLLEARDDGIGPGCQSREPTSPPWLGCQVSGSSFPRIPRRSAMRTRSASDLTRIFCMT
jgi:hypothetical protein